MTSESPTRAYRSQKASPHVVTSREAELESSIDAAARHTVPVLITAPMEQAALIVQAIAVRNHSGPVTGILKCDSGSGAEVDAFIAEVGPGVDTILWLNEVQRLTGNQQADIIRLLDRARPSRPLPRLIASSPVDLFGLVSAGLFDETLFYRLNTIHIVVGSEPGFVRSGNEVHPSALTD